MAHNFFLKSNKTRYRHGRDSFSIPGVPSFSPDFFLGSLYLRAINPRAHAIVGAHRIARISCHSAHGCSELASAFYLRPTISTVKHFPDLSIADLDRWLLEQRVINESGIVKLPCKRVTDRSTFHDSSFPFNSRNRRCAFVTLGIAATKLLKTIDFSVRDRKF